MTIENSWRINGVIADNGSFTSKEIGDDDLNHIVKVTDNSLDIQGIVACGYENVDWFTWIPKEVLLQLLKNAKWI